MNGPTTTRDAGGSGKWWIVFVKEAHELWVGGRALTLLLIFTVLMGILTWVLASNSELSLIPPKEMVYEMLKAALAVGVFIGVIIGADSISGERERSTLEGLLLTPTSRRQIVVGKFLAAITPWPAAFAVSLPYLWVLAQGDEVFGQAVLWGGLFGTILVLAFTALSMFVSFWCNTNRTSLFVALGIYLFFLVPTQLPGSAQTGGAGRFYQWVNPLQAPDFFLEKIMVNNRTLAELWTWFTTPVVLCVVSLSLLFLYARPGLRLEAGRVPRPRMALGQSAGAFLLGALLTLGPVPVLALHSVQQEPMGEPAEPVAMQAAAPLEVGIDMEYVTVRAGESVLYETRVTNHSAQASPGLILAMNIINLDALGDIVDPEDWSPQRTQYHDGLAPGESATHSWRVNAILDGDYMIYMVAIPQPDGQEATSHPVSSPGIHLTVTEFTRLNPGGVLPFAIGGPILVLLGLLYVYRRRRRGIDVGG